MATFSFVGTGAADWNVGTNWTPATVPTAADTALLTGTGATAVISSGATDAVASVTMTGDNLLVGNSTLFGNTLTGNGTLTAGTIDDTNATLVSSQGSSVTGTTGITVGTGAAIGGGGSFAVTTGAIANSGVIRADGADFSLGNLTVTAPSITATGALEVWAGSTLELNVPSVAATQTISVVASGVSGATGAATVDLDQPTFGGTISIAAPNTLDLFLETGQTATAATVTGSTLNITTSAGTETIALGAAGYTATLTPAGAGGRAEIALNPVCFARGTRIATPEGAVAVEDLQAGDLVTTAGGETSAVVWVGHRGTDCQRHPEPRKVWPVRIREGAFGPNLPERDLLVSPQHAIFDEGVLIPAKVLINGSTITQEPVARVEYYHVELARHDLLLAEGLPTESYLDTGDRASFENGGGAMILHPDFARWAWDARACAELRVTGPELDAVRAKLAMLADHMASPQRLSA